MIAIDLFFLTFLTLEAVYIVTLNLIFVVKKKKKELYTVLKLGLIGRLNIQSKLSTFFEDARRI